MEHRHINHGTQVNKPHAKKSNRGPKVADVAANRTATTSLELGRAQRYNQCAQLRKQKRDDLLLKRRGLNFVTDKHEATLPEECVDVVEKEVDNVAPKIVGILGLSASCDTSRIREALADHCVDYMESLRPV